MPIRTIRQALVSSTGNLADPLRLDTMATIAVDQMRALKPPEPAVKYQFRIHYYVKANLLLGQLSKEERQELRDDCRDLLALGHRPEDLHSRDLPYRWLDRFARLQVGIHKTVSQETFLEALSEAAFDSAVVKPRKAS